MLTLAEAMCNWLQIDVQVATNPVFRAPCQMLQSDWATLWGHAVKSDVHKSQKELSDGRLQVLGP